MSNLTKEDIEKGKIRGLRRTIDDEKTVFTVIYEIDEVRYRFELDDDKINDNEKLILAIGEKLLTLEKIEPPKTVEGPKVETVRELIGERITFEEPTEATETLLEISALDAEKPEGNEGVTPFTFTVTRSGVISTTTTVNWVVTGFGDRPADGNDFEGGVFPSGSLTFEPDETSLIITVNVQGDNVQEPDETFVVTLSDARNLGSSIPVTIITDRAVGTIINDDQAERE